MKAKLFVGFTLLALVSIWGNSLCSSNISNAISDTITTLVGGEITHTDTQEETAATWLTSGHIRKLAHMGEFCVLGAGSVLFTVLRHKKVRDCLSQIALFGLSVGLIDETIQLFNDRTSTVKDVWIDFAGFIIGVLLLWLMTTLLQKKKGKRVGAIHEKK